MEFLIDKLYSEKDAVHFIYKLIRLLRSEAEHLGESL